MEDLILLCSGFSCFQKTLKSLFKKTTKKKIQKCLIYVSKMSLKLFKDITWYLTLYFAMLKNGQTHFKNLAAFAARFLKCV